VNIATVRRLSETPGNNTKKNAATDRRPSPPAVVFRTRVPALPSTPIYEDMILDTRRGGDRWIEEGVVRNVGE